MQQAWKEDYLKGKIVDPYKWMNDYFSLHPSTKLVFKGSDFYKVVKKLPKHMRRFYPTPGQKLADEMTAFRQHEYTLRE
jgi:hypothetical protein